MDPGNMEKRREIRRVIEQFLQERFDAKLKGKHFMPGDPEYEALRNRFERAQWIADAARRVGQIQAVTHVLKATHPDARGTSLYRAPDSLMQHAPVGSHHLPRDFTDDVVGNAGALDVYKFLRLEHDGKSLLAWMEEEDSDLSAALSDDASQAREWMRAFVALTERTGDTASHSLAKQLYWLVGDDREKDEQYHLLAPLYASSLAFHLHTAINGDRFGETAKAAREARKQEQYSEHSVREYPNLAVQKLGGTKPQNISQLNSQRGGNNYLLASTPPIWKSRKVRPPRGAVPVFERFGFRRSVRSLINQFSTFLESDPPSTLATRNHRDDLLDQIIGELYQYAEELRALPSGWSADPDCRLPDAEKMWLDPGRAELDPEFAEAWKRGEWEVEVRHRFANWLNEALGDELPLGDIEHAFWMDALGGEAWRRSVAVDPHATKEKEFQNV